MIGARRAAFTDIAEDPVCNASTPATTPHAFDDPEAWASFSVRCDAEGKPLATTSPEVRGPALWRSDFTIDGIYCSGCALIIEAALRSVSGARSAQVDGAARRAQVVWDAASTHPGHLIDAVAKTHCRARPGLSPTTTQERRKEQRLLLWRWLVAGLCMMQVMMYAMPAYVAAPADMTPDVTRLLRWASWVLTLPVVLFSCTPFFKRALADLMARRISMDLPVGLGMAIAFIVSTAATFSPGGLLGHEVYFDSLTMFVFFLLSGRWLEHRLRARTAGALEALIDRLPETVERLKPVAGAPMESLSRLHDRAFERVSLSRLRVGDIARVRIGEAFPADGRLVDGQTQVDEALLTGESTPILRTSGSISAAVIAGSFNRGATVLMQIEGLGESTRFSEIVELMRTASMQKPRIAAAADRVAGPFMAFVIVAALGSLVWWWPIDPSRAFMVCVSVLIVTCPCALSLATPAALLAAAGALARRGVLVRNLDALEALAGADVVVFDKTGTLTDASLKVRGVVTRAGVSEAHAVSWAAQLARHSAHPVSRAVAGFAAAKPDDVACASNIEETPGRGIQGMASDGRVLRLGSAAFCNVGASGGSGEAIRRDVGQDLCVVTYLADERGWLATLVLDEALRQDAREAVNRLCAAGLGITLMSGDRPDAAERVALALGIARHAGHCTPEDKLARLRALQADGHRVVMVGDGLNDGPVLAAADVSFAVGTQMPLAHAQADLVILGAQLSVLPDAIMLARGAMRVVRQNLAWAAGYNLVFVPLAMAGCLPAWLAGLGMAASSLLVVANAARLARVPVEKATGTRQSMPLEPADFGHFAATLDKQAP